MQLPSIFIESLRGIPGFDEISFKEIHESGEQVVSLRLNPAKTFPVHWNKTEKIPWSSYGYYLPERPSFTLDPFLHAGAYYVQEASSMFLEYALQQTTDLTKPLVVLDLCAAPGGKSTLIQSVISPESVLVSNEIIRQRAGVLEENLTKWGGPNVIVTNNKPSDFSRLAGLFDIIVVDAPCSGSGLFRKDPAAIGEWSPQNVQMCSMRQRQLLSDIIPCLKEDGVLIYSTCSYSVAEDEEIASWLVHDFPLDAIPLNPPASWNIISRDQGPYGYRFYPDKLKGEGFFLAAFRKSQGEKALVSRKKLSFLRDISVIRPWIKDDANLKFLLHNDQVLILPDHTSMVLNSLDGLYIKKAGVSSGSLVRSEFVPGHALAVSTLISGNIPAVELSEEEALQYLRRNEFNFPKPRKGWTVIRYKGINLGFVKGLGNRINNYYPKEWRILNK